MNIFELISYGKLHGDDPKAHLHVDLTELLRDPHVSPELRELTGLHDEVRDRVLSQRGASAVIRATVDAAEAWRLIVGPFSPTRVGIACSGGRHRSVVIVEEVAYHLTLRGWAVHVAHRHLHRPVVTR